jgi:hypothetical protein
MGNLEEEGCVSPGKYTIVFQTKIYAILACAYKIQINARPQKYVSICSDSQVAVKTLQAAKTTSPLVQQCRKAVNNISTQYSVELFWAPRHSGVRGNEIANGLTREGTVHQFVGQEPALRVSRQNIRKIKCWTDNQHMAMRWGLTSTQRQLQKLISGPNPTAKTRLLSFHRLQTRVVTSLLTGRNTLRRNLYIMGLIDSPLCRRCGAEKETSVHFCVSVKPSDTQTYLFVFLFLGL